MIFLMTTKTTTTLVIVALMAVLSIAAVSTFVDSAFAAKPGGVPPAGRDTGVCARAAAGPDSANCAPTFRGP
jgi:hypothetical protein